MSEPYRPRRSRHTPAAQGSKWIRPSTRWAIYYRDDFACVYCGAIGPLSLDHVAAVARSGRKNAPENLVTCCIACNSSKQGLEARAWYAKLRAAGRDVGAIRRRIARLTSKALDRERGRLLARHRGDESGYRVDDYSGDDDGKNQAPTAGRG